MIRRRRFLIILFILGAFLAAVAAAQRTLISWVTSEIKRESPVPVNLGPVRWSYPVGVVIEGATVPNPPGSEQPHLLKVERIVLKVPIWGLFVRPIPFEALFKAPFLHVDTGSLDFIGELFLNQFTLPEKKPGLVLSGQGLDEENPEEVEPEKPERGSAAPFAPSGLRITEGRIDFTDKEVRADHPVISVAHLEVRGEIAQPLLSPTIHVNVQSKLVTPDLQPTGFVTIESRFEPRLNHMEGRLQFWHDDLKELRRLYYYAPQPFFFEGGRGGPIVEWKVNGKEVWASLRCLAENLKIDGMVGDVPWQRILDALMDSQGKIDVAVSARGRLGDPAFDIHDRILSELDWAVKERAAARGVQVPTRIFFGLDKSPSAEEDNEEEPPSKESEETGE